MLSFVRPFPLLRPPRLAPTKWAPTSVRTFSFRRNAVRQYEYFDNRRPFYQQRRFWLLAAGTGGVFGAYYISNLEVVPISGRRRFMAVDQSEEEQMAKMAYKSIINEYRNRILPGYHPHTIRVQRVADRLIQVSGMQGLRWEINVIESPEVNAFVLPGGKIFVFTGILKVAGDDNALAAVLGHEIAHQVARHSAEKLSIYKLLFMARFALSFVIDTSLIFNPLLVSLGVTLPFSRKCETEADYLGLLFMAQACYDPRAAIPFWQRMKEVHSGQGAQFLSTHPNPENRIEKLREWMPKAIDRFEMSQCETEIREFADMFRGRWARW